MPGGEEGEDSANSAAPRSAAAAALIAWAAPPPGSKTPRVSRARLGVSSLRPESAARAFPALGGGVASRDAQLAASSRA